MSQKSERRAGEGGHASVEGDHSFAQGGDGGDGPNGGAGGAANVQGNYSGALGGPGGRGGRGEGMAGGDANVLGDHGFAAGGQGGEASQIDGRGGRGGRSFPFHSVGRHIKAPWWAPSKFEPGRGGDGADTPQYRARRIIIELLKHQYFIKIDKSATEEEIWYDRDFVPIKWLNDMLLQHEFQWSASLDDWEYVFSDK